ncbi:hypothetical protein chiPu_0027181, partial [Chiloscyllium punctatum]|nr:hypothetical protein [Chiloscyllium punctatum]
MAGGDGGVAAIGAIQADHTNIGCAVVKQRHMHARRLAPQSEQAQAAVRKGAGGGAPGAAVDADARPWVMPFNSAACPDQIDQCRHVSFSLALAQEVGDVLEPDNERSRKIDARSQHQREMREHRQIGRFGRRRTAARLAERKARQAQHERAEGEQQAKDQRDREQRLAREGRADDEKFAHEDTERRQTGDCDNADHQAPAERGMGFSQAANVGDPLRALHLRDVADRVEDPRLCQAVHHHVQQAGEVGERAAHPECKHDDAHMLDRGIGEQPFDIAAAVEHEGREQQRERDVEQQAGEHGGDRGRALGVRIRQPGVQRREANLGPVSEQQEDEGNVEQCRIECRGAADQHCPDHRVLTLADDRQRGHVDQDGTKQRERDADAAEDEIFPGSLQRRVGPVDADHQDGGERRDLDRDPHQADIVRHECEVHAE